MSKINILSSDLVNKIAAGEVIERPASIVKELLENSVDSGASEITLKLENGGLQLIEVIDNGSGMNIDDARLAFTQHATSKINNIEDLESIISLGFRGEALASIAGISRASIHTFDGKSFPVNVTSVAAEVSATEGNARNKGTTVTVRGIFDNIPARKKFLRSAATEYKYIVSIFINIVLTQPKIHFKLIKEAKTVFDLPSTTNTLDRVLEVFPDIKANELIPISSTQGNIRIEGLLGHPKLAKAHNSRQFLFLNKRAINDKLLNKAVKEGFHTSIPRDLQPHYFIYLELDPKEVDINVHPRKLEVRFVNPGQVFNSVRNSVANTLEKSMQAEFKQHLNQENDSELIPDFSEINSNSKSSFQFERSSSAHSNSTKESLEFTKNLLRPQRFEEQEAFQELQIEETNMAGSSFLQVFNTYLILERQDKLLVIDQHAADERIKFEMLERALAAKNLPTQSLLVPDILNPSQQEQATVKDFHQYLKDLGFVIEQFSNSDWQLTEVPSLLAGKNYLTTLKDILSELNETDGHNHSQAFNASLEHIIATIACHGSIRAGQKLSAIEAGKLISDLLGCKLPYSCPHGRPIIWEIPRPELEKQFKRRK